MFIVSGLFDIPTKFDHKIVAPVEFIVPCDTTNVSNLTAKMKNILY